MQQEFANKIPAYGSEHTDKYQLRTVNVKQPPQRTCLNGKSAHKCTMSLGQQKSEYEDSDREHSESVLLDE